jgi:hexosaminidase
VFRRPFLAPNQRSTFCTAPTMVVGFYLLLVLATTIIALNNVVDGKDVDTTTRMGSINDGYGYEIGNRLFPAAQLELYTPTNSVLGVVSVRNLTVTTTTTNTSTARHGQEVVDNILQSAINRFIKSLERLPDFDIDYAVNPSNLPLHVMDRIKISVESVNTKLYHGVKEDYVLCIPDDRSEIVLMASTVFGALHGLETLGQLLEYGWTSSLSSITGKGGRSGSSSRTGWDHNNDAIFVIRDIPLYISDAPSYPFRGLMIDTARHYLPLDLILDNLDIMAMNKLNILHWHISDSQSFPYESRSYPELATKGAYHPKRIYTVQEIERVINEAYRRGIRVIPEIDMPGHTNAIAKSHPEVMAQCPHPAEPMNPTVPETYQFVETVYKDLNDLFPDDYVHVGGDEVELSEKCWLNSPQITQWMKDHKMNKTVELYEYFETRLLEIVSGLGKTPIVWQEVFNLNLTIPNNTIIDVWKGFDKYTIQNATLQNYQVVLSGCWYLDHLGDSWSTFYRCDPRNFTGGNTDLMIGGHASMWGENVDASNFISRVWPRASAVAERLWTGDISKGASTTIDDRIHNFRCRMVQQGFDAGPTRPGSCPSEVRYQPSRCDNTHSERKGSGSSVEDDAVKPGSSSWWR